MTLPNQLQAAQAGTSGNGLSRAPAQATGPMLKLGEINSRIAPISISADGLAQLGFTPDPAVKTANLYRAADLPLILGAMVRHLKGAGVDLLQSA